MRIATTTADFQRDADNNIDRTKLIAQCGFKYIDYSFGRDFAEKVGFFGDYNTYLKQLKDVSDELGVKFVQSHAPMGDPITKNDKYDEFIEGNKLCIKACYDLGIPNIVVHSGYEKGISKEECFARNKEFYELLLPTAEKYNVEILTENFNKRWHPEIYWVDNAPDLKELVDYINHPLLNACWDIGHGNLQDMPQHEAMAILGDRIRALHVQDNYNRCDSHKAPLFGTTNWDSVMHGLKSIGFNGYFTFEADNLLTSGYAKRQFDGDNRLLNPPLELKLKAEQLMYDIGKYILMSYDCFEE